MTTDAIESVIANGLSFLREEGYVLSSISREDTQATGRACHVAYVSDEFRRRICVSYYYAHRTILTSISDVDRELDFSDSGAMYVREPKFSAIFGEGVEKTERYMLALREELRNRYADVLHGQPFNNDAFDWSPYK